MRFSAACALFLTTLLAAPMAQAKDSPPEELAMSGKWVMGYEPTFCALSGDFGDGDARVTLQLIRYSPNDSFELRLYGKRFQESQPSSQALVDFNSDGSFSQRMVFHGMAGDVPIVLAGIRSFAEATDPGSDPVSVTPAMEAGVTNVTIRVGNKYAFKLALPTMGPAMRALRDCTTDLVRRWGLDPEVQQQLSSKPQPRNVASWLRLDEYPERSLRAGENVTIRYRLNVDSSGNTTHCEILGGATSPEVASFACERLKQRAKFKPAVDSAGNPAASYYIGSTTWMIP